MSLKETAHFLFRNYVKFAAFNGNMLTNHNLHHKQNNSIVTTGVNIKINLHFLFSSVFVRGLGWRTPDEWPKTVETECFGHLQPLL